MLKRILVAVTSIAVGLTASLAGISPAQALTHPAPSSVVATAGVQQATLVITYGVQDPLPDPANFTDRKIEFSSNAGSSWTEFAEAVSTSTEATVTGLTGGTAYIFRVSANYGGGWSDPSANSNSVTPTLPVTAPAAPTITATAGDTQATATIVYGSNGNAAIDDREIELSSDSGANWSIFTEDNSTSTTASITGLVNGTSYVFRVKAHNSAGWSDWSATSAPVIPTPDFVATAPAAPTITSVTAGDGQVTVVFTPGDDGGSVITNYNVSYALAASQSSWIDFERDDSTATSVAVTGLTNGVAYVFRVNAENVVGAGVDSAPSASVTPAAAGPVVTVPAIPTAISAVAGIKGITVSFTPGATGGAAITDYAIWYSSNSGSTWTLFADGTSVATKILVTGLTGGSSYLFKVAAVNSAGTGPAKATVTTVVQWTKLGHKVFGGFTQGSAVLTAANKTALKAWIKSLSGEKRVYCAIPSRSAKTTSADYKIARARALAVCNYIKSLNKTVVTYLRVTYKVTSIANYRKVTVDLYKY